MIQHSPQLYKRAENVSPGGVQSTVRAFKSVGGTPLFFKEAKGAYLYSVEGGEFIDFCQSFGPLILGHRDPDVQARVEEMIGKAWTFGACEPYSLELAEWIIENVPHIERLRFVNSGTEAVMSAVRLAKGATGRDKIIKFEGCYHGHMDSLLVKSGSGLAGVAASDSAGVSEKVASETIVLPIGDREAVEKAFLEHKDEIAAIIVEPLPANFGLLKQSCAYLRYLREVTEKNGALLIYDEVISGFRVAMGGMAEISEVKPDLVTYGKIIGGGFPVGCYGGKKELMDHVAPLGPVYQAGTLSGSPVGMVAGLATLEKIKKENVIDGLRERGDHFVEALEAQIQSLDLPLKIVNFGSLMWFHASDKKEPQNLSEINKNQGELFSKLFYFCLDEGIYLAPSGYEVSFLSWAHNERIIVECVHKFKNAFVKLKESLD
ncbi:MAG: glutamate-1-semialdehyde 2,1-aminomutase [Pseudomonadota bacterium]